MPRTNKFILCLLFLTGITFTCKGQNLYSSKNAEVSFFSKTAVEDIDAKNTQATSILNTNTQEIVFFVPVKGFRFKNGLMQDHFNEKYLESDVYPDATYKGKINEKLDFSKDGTYSVTTTGKLKIHGVEHDVTEKGTLTMKEGTIHLVCTFTAKLADYKIEPPKLVVKNIAEAIDVNIDSNYTLYKK